MPLALAGPTVARVPRPPLTRSAGALLRAAHAGPTVAVTGFVLLWGAVGVGLPPGTVVLLVAAVLSGQLAIGWCNDWADAGRDTEAGRLDKPVATGEVTRRQVGAAAVAAVAATVVLSLSLGLLAGLAHLVVVAAGLAYDFGLKSVLASPVPYAVAFGTLPAVATLAAAEPSRPAPGIMAATALLGVAAHLANTVPDAEDDARTGVRGLPQRLGPRRSAVGAGLVLAVAALVVLPVAAEGDGARRVLATGLLVGGVVLGLVGGLRVLLGGGGTRRVGRSAFWCVVAAAGLVVLGVLVA